MKKLYDSRTAQISLDLAFAILLVLTVTMSMYDYSEELSGSIVTNRRLEALNALADYAADNLNSFHNSVLLTGGSNSSYSLKMLDEYAFADAGGNKYELNYTLAIDCGSNCELSFMETSRPPGPDLIVAVRTLGYSINCITGMLPAWGLEGGQTLNLQGCSLSGDDLSCGSCYVT